MCSRDRQCADVVEAVVAAVRIRGVAVMGLGFVVVVVVVGFEEDA